MTKAARLAVLLLPLSVSAHALGLEDAAAASSLSFSALGALPALRFSPRPAKAAPKLAALPDLAALFESGTMPTQKELDGWRSGRRFTKSGPAAALLVGKDVYDKPEDGPIGGSTFKLFLFGADEPGLSPVDLYDDPPSELVNATIGYIREDGGKWSAAAFKPKGVLTRKESAPPIELRKAGDYIVARYGDGTYGYFFKKVRR